MIGGDNQHFARLKVAGEGWGGGAGIVSVKFEAESVQSVELASPFFTPSWTPPPPP